jgi:hypothetical protein
MSQFGKNRENKDKKTHEDYDQAAKAIFLIKRSYLLQNFRKEKR